MPGIKAQAPAWADLKSASFDPESLWLRVDGDVELLRELVGVFEQESAGMLARLGTAIQQGDASGVEKSAHKIKGSLLQFSGQKAATMALQLEQMGKGNVLAEAAALLRALKPEVDLLHDALQTMLRRMAEAPGAGPAAGRTKTKR